MNKREAIQAMLEGKLLSNSDYLDTYFYLDDNGNFKDSDGCLANINAEENIVWRIYQKSKKVIYHKYFYSGSNSIIHESHWTTDSFQQQFPKDIILITTEQREFEVPCE